MPDCPDKNIIAAAYVMKYNLYTCLQLKSGVFLHYRLFAGQTMVTSRSWRDVMAASITSARTESVQTKKFTSASSMNTKLCHHSELTDSSY